MWLVRNHPLYLSVYPSGSNVQANSQGSHVQGNSQLPHSRVSAPTNVADRHAILRNVFDDILTRVTDITTFGNFHNVLVTHRSSLYHSKSLLMPPRKEITNQQASAGLGAVAEVLNLANYRRDAKNRKQTAQFKDPTCYNLHKKAAHNELVVCDCGESVRNDHKITAKHRQRSQVHKAWLTQYFAQRGADANGANAVFWVYPIC